MAAVGLAVAPIRGWPSSWFTHDATVVPFTDVPDNFTGMRGGGQEQFPGQNRIAQDLRELDSWITPVSDLFDVSHDPIPEVDAARIGGTRPTR